MRPQLSKFATPQNKTPTMNRARSNVSVFKSPPPPPPPLPPHPPPLPPPPPPPSGQAATSIKTPTEATVLWRNVNVPTQVIADRCWAFEFSHHAPCDTDIVIKAGNKDVCLENYSHEQDVRISELLLKRRYSEIYPVGDYFFFIGVRDRSLGYERYHKIVIDIPTAYAFFGEDPTDTCNLVGQLVRSVVDTWNAKHRDVVSRNRCCKFYYNTVCCHL